MWASSGLVLGVQGGHMWACSGLVLGVQGGHVGLCARVCVWACGCVGVWVCGCVGLVDAPSGRGLKCQRHSRLELPTTTSTSSGSNRLWRGQAVCCW